MGTEKKIGIRYQAFDRSGVLFEQSGTNETHHLTKPEWWIPLEGCKHPYHLNMDEETKCRGADWAQTCPKADYVWVKRIS